MTVIEIDYIGQLSIIGIPYIAYKAEFVVGSVLIACGAVIIALYIMFIMLRPKLKHTWISKIGVAFILAFAVCSMHYTGESRVNAWMDDLWSGCVLMRCRDERNDICLADRARNLA